MNHLVYLLFAIAAALVLALIVGVILGAIALINRYGNGFPDKRPDFYVGTDSPASELTKRYWIRGRVIRWMLVCVAIIGALAIVSADAWLPDAVRRVFHACPKYPSTEGDLKNCRGK